MPDLVTVDLYSVHKQAVSQVGPFSIFNQAVTGFNQRIWLSNHNFSKSNRGLPCFNQHFWAFNLKFGDSNQGWGGFNQGCSCPHQVSVYTNTIKTTN